MIPSTLRIVLLVGVLVYFIVLLLFLKNKALELKYTLLWMNGLFLIAIAFLVMLSMTLTSIVSRQMRKINRLVQQVAILENELTQKKDEEQI